MSYYGKYKYKSFLYVSKNLKKKDINYLWLRPSLTYGYGDNKERYLGYIINSIKKNNKQIKIKPGNQIRDYIHVNDLCKVLNLPLGFHHSLASSVNFFTSWGFMLLCSILKPNLYLIKIPI